MSEVKTIFFGLFGDPVQIKASIPVVQAIKAKYPTAKLSYATSQADAANLLGIPGIDEVLPFQTPGSAILTAYSSQYDKVFLPTLLNQEQMNWSFESKWIRKHPYNTLSDYMASRCLDDIEITDRESIPKEEEKADPPKQQGE